MSDINQRSPASSRRLFALLDDPFVWVDGQTKERIPPARSASVGTDTLVDRVQLTLRPWNRDPPRRVFLHTLPSTPLLPQERASQARLGVPDRSIDELRGVPSFKPLKEVEPQLPWKPVLRQLAVPDDDLTAEDMARVERTRPECVSRAYCKRQYLFTLRTGSHYPVCSWWDDTNSNDLRWDEREVSPQ